jgi:tRNA nucleotidyltransferase/poly(A) polymerase
MDEIRARLNHPTFERIVSLLPVDPPIYLVGGAIRDALLNKSSYDLDFITQVDALKIARKLADELGGAYFPLDETRNVARIILKPTRDGKSSDGQMMRVDIANFQGADLISDLKGRDFTINAMALEVHHPGKVIDPTGGAADLIAKKLRACSEDAFQHDPVRIIRAVRFSVNLGLTIQPDTLKRMREAVVHLTEVSAERVRDELFRILTLPRPATSIRILDKLGVLEVILPEVCVLKHVQQPAPHVLDAWNHTMDIMNRLESLLKVLSLDYNPDKASNLALGMVLLQLGRYREQIAEHLSSGLNPERPLRGLIFLAGLYHDAGKFSSQSMDERGKIKFTGHEQIGRSLAEKRGQALKLSNLEITRLMTIVGHHMRPSLLSHTDELPSKKAIYRFFRDTGAAGVDICLLSLADILATYGPTLSQERWSRHLEVVRILLNAWWENREVQVLPSSMVNGEDLMNELRLVPGPIIGYMLESIREAQVAGDIHNKEDAINYARMILEESVNKKNGLIR